MCVSGDAFLTGSTVVIETIRIRFDPLDVVIDSGGGPRQVCWYKGPPELETRWVADVLKTSSIEFWEIESEHSGAGHLLGTHVQANPAGTISFN